MRFLLILAVVATAWFAGASARSGELLERPMMSQRVDELLREEWTRKGIKPAGTSSDAEFLRRVNLDLNGVIPRVSRVREFVADENPEKRVALIDELIASPRFSTHLATTWRSVILTADFDPAQLQRAAGLQRWLRQQFMANLRYDRIVAEFLSATGTAETGPAIFYQELEGRPEKLAANTSRVFLGIQMQCAECHDHPFDEWTQKDFWGYAAFFAQLPTANRTPGAAFQLVDLNEGDVTLPETDEIVKPKYPNGDVASASVGGTRRQQLAIWMASRDNPFLARAAVNRVWAHLFGAGLVDPVDDMSPQNIASHPQLLEELTDHFVRSGFDLQDLFRVLANTEAYQLTSKSSPTGPRVPVLFERMALKRMTPEQLYDSLQQTLGMPTPTDSTTDPERQAFLVQMRTLSRDATEYDLGLQQVLNLMNGPRVSSMTTSQEQGLLASLQAPFFDDAERIDVLFLASMSRRPDTEERATFLGHLEAQTDSSAKQRAAGDVLWALINSAEYQLNH